MAKFLKSAKNIDTDFPIDNVMEFCFMGRSNVGKSSVINALANQIIAKRSKTPGRTQLVNLFDFGDFRLVDLPGYGYAKINKEQQQQISLMIGDYLTKRKNLFCVFQVCDIRTVTELDLKMINFIKTRFTNYYIILNKCDQVSKSFFDNNRSKISQKLSTPSERLIPFSATEKINVAYVKKIINNIVNHDK